MSSRITVISLALVLILSFFLPWIDTFIQVSAIDILFGSVSKQLESNFKYVILFIPISAGYIVFTELFNKGQYVFSKPVLFRIPFITALLILIVCSIEISKSNRGFRISDVERLIGALGVGFWIMFISAIVMTGVVRKKKLQTHILSTNLYQ